LRGLIAGGRDGFSAALFYTTVYALTLLGAFGVVGYVRQQTGGDELKHFAGLRARSPLLAACLAVFMLSLAGLPPLAGFFGKFYLFAAALGAGEQHGLLWLVALALFGSLVSLYYYLLVLKAAFADEVSSSASGANAPGLLGTCVAVLAAAVVVLGILPGGFVSQVVKTIP